MWLCSFDSAAEEVEVLAIELKINFLSPAIGEKVVAYGSVANRERIFRFAGERFLTIERGKKNWLQLCSQL